ncbi:MAG TPA: hypothetical protein VFD92_06040 [Candidatus Binatia bacterium]|nr:hypothetical protein [Candidatus Binatia bacterium]
MLRTIRSMVEGVSGATAAVLLVACSYSPPVALDTPTGLYRTLNTAPYGTATQSDRWTVVDNPAGLRADHGFACVSASRGGSRDFIGIRVQDSAAIPTGYDATVFMNGWKSSYKKKDHHVLGLGSIIFNIDKQPSQLVWDAGGVIADKNGDDAFEWCYHYTVLFWPKTDPFDIRAVHSDSSGQLIFVDDNQHSNVVHSIPGSYTPPGTGRPPVAALPSGFALAWTDSDHHVLQLGYDLGSASLSGTTLGWTSNAILKDNSARRDYYAFEAVTILRGSGFDVRHPSTLVREKNDGTTVSQSNALQLSPRSPTSCAGELVEPSRFESFTITGLDARAAIPMLTGWELRYTCEDQHVRSAGAWIEDWDYTPPTNFLGTNGTLHYTVGTTLADKNGVPNFLDRLEVSVLAVGSARRVVNPNPNVFGNAVPLR